MLHVIAVWPIERLGAQWHCNGQFSVCHDQWWKTHISSWSRWSEPSENPWLWCLACNFLKTFSMTGGVFLHQDHWHWSFSNIWTQWTKRHQSPASKVHWGFLAHPRHYGQPFDGSVSDFSGCFFPAGCSVLWRNFCPIPFKPPSLPVNDRVRFYNYESILPPFPGVS